MIPVEDEVPLLECRGVTIDFPSRAGVATPVSGFNLRMSRGKSVGIVGESGSGKSVALRSIIGLTAQPGKLRSGEILLYGRDISRIPEREYQQIRGSVISMIYQEPTACLNPVATVGSQLCEVLRVKLGLSRSESRDRAVDLLEKVGVTAPQQRLRSYAHELSGGIAQRVMIALAIAAGPDLLLADEPTTALDVSVQDQVLTLLDQIRRETGMSMLIVSHDMGVVARSCDEIVVMYAGRVMERGTAREVLDNPRNPYTKMLLLAMPTIEVSAERKPLYTIAGQLPDLRTVATGCPFRTRCPLAEPRCADATMDLPPSGHVSACVVLEGDRR